MAKINLPRTTGYSGIKQNPVFLIQYFGQFLTTKAELGFSYF